MLTLSHFLVWKIISKMIPVTDFPGDKRKTLFDQLEAFFVLKNLSTNIFGWVDFLFKYLRSRQTAKNPTYIFWQKNTKFVGRKYSNPDNLLIWMVYKRWNEKMSGDAKRCPQMKENTINSWHDIMIQQFGRDLLAFSRKHLSNVCHLQVWFN